MIPYQVIYSKRRTLAVQVTREGNVIVRAPRGISDTWIQSFVEKHRDWIEKRVRTAKENAGFWPEVTPEEEKQFREQARRILEEKTAYYAEKMGVTYGRISIRGQKTRWGSCSREGNLNFNWKLMLCPEPVQDYVVVHELAHRKEMNHSKAFYRIVEQVLPGYRDCVRWLREHP